MTPLNKKILVVDDDKLFQGVYSGKFKDDGFEVLTANDGEEAWQLITGGWIPDLVFTGVTMPHMGGFDLIRKLQLDPKFTLVPTVVFSHRGLQEDRETALWLGVDDFIAQGNTSLFEVSRRIKLILGLNTKYEISIKRHESDNEAMISLLSKQQSNRFILDKKQDVFLEIEPQKETGEFKVSLMNKKPKESS